jgi:hypothetical protein
VVVLQRRCTLLAVRLRKEPNCDATQMLRLLTPIVPYFRRQAETAQRHEDAKHPKGLATTRLKIPTNW